MAYKQRWEAWFNQFDVNKKGSLSMGDADAYLKVLYNT